MIYAITLETHKSGIKLRNHISNQTPIISGIHVITLQTYNITMQKIAYKPRKSGCYFHRLASPVSDYHQKPRCYFKILRFYWGRMVKRVFREGVLFYRWGIVVLSISTSETIFAITTVTCSMLLSSNSLGILFLQLRKSAFKMSINGGAITEWMMSTLSSFFSERLNIPTIV